MPWLHLSSLASVVLQEKPALTSEKQSQIHQERTAGANCKNDTDLFLLLSGKNDDNSNRE
jgi:hypothetical protein